MFHIELRQFPHVAREFNLSRAALDTRFIAPWTAGQVVDSGERKWAPERARLTIYEGPQLRPDEIGMGRGWANVMRGGQDVTAQILEAAERSPEREAALAQLKQELLDRCASGAIDIRSTMEVATELHPELRVSDRLALAEQAIWELLHAGSVTMTVGGGAVDPERWQGLLLSWSTWGREEDPGVLVEAAPG